MVPINALIRRFSHVRIALQSAIRFNPSASNHAALLLSSLWQSVMRNDGRGEEVAVVTGLYFYDRLVSDLARDP